MSRKTHRIRFIVFIGCLWALTGCSDDATNSQGSTDANQVKEEIVEAVDATGAFISQQKDQVLETASQQYDQLEEDSRTLINQLKKSVSDDETLKTAVAELESQLEDTGIALDDLKEAGKENWEDTQKAFEVALKELKDAYQKAKAQYDNS